jgi:hypothetical protein
MASPNHPLMAPAALPALKDSLGDAAEEGG